MVNLREIDAFCFAVRDPVLGMKHVALHRQDSLCRRGSNSLYPNCQLPASYNRISPIRNQFPPSSVSAVFGNNEYGDKCAADCDRQCPLHTGANVDRGSGTSICGWQEV